MNKHFELPSCLNWILGGAFVACLTGFTACSRVDSPSSETSADAEPTDAPAPVCEAGLAAFKTTLHPLLKQQCAACHSPEGAGGAGGIHGPPHSVADAEASYRLMIKDKYMAYANLEKSKVVTKGGNLHCKDYGGDCTATDKEILPLVKAWWEQGEKTCKHDLPIQSAEFALPSPLPDLKQGFARMRLKLEEIDAEYKGLFFEFEIQRNAAATPERPGSYLIQRPRFLSTGGNWRVKKIQFALNGDVQAATNVYNDVDTLVTEETNVGYDSPIWPEHVVSVASGIMLEKAAATDKIRVGFGEITKVAAGAQCHDLEMFVEKVKPTVSSLGCPVCHAAVLEKFETAQARFNLAGDDAQLCKQFSRQSKHKNIMLSPVLWFPMHGRPVHPNVIPFPEAVMPEWGDWIARGS